MTAPHSGSRLFRFSVFEVDFESGELRKQGRRIVLHEQPFQALILLLEHPGEVVTREQLRLRLWPVDTFVEFDKNLNTTISKVREVLGDSAVHPRFIETLPRRGYRFLAPVEEVLATKQPEAEAPIERLVGDQTGSVPPADQPATAKSGADRRWLTSCSSERLRGGGITLFVISSYMKMDRNSGLYISARVEKSKGVPLIRNFWT
jgi:DNA-binding winged helix-turn-helix (wHTH) protein